MGVEERKGMENGWRKCVERVTSGSSVNGSSSHANGSLRLAWTNAALLH